MFTWRRPSADSRNDGIANPADIPGARNPFTRALDRCAEFLHTVVAAVSARRELIAQTVTAICFFAGIAATVLDFLGFVDIATVIRIIAGIGAAFATVLIGKVRVAARAVAHAVGRAARGVCQVWSTLRRVGRL